MMKWCLRHTKAILDERKAASWSSQWLRVLKQETEKGFHPELPKYGFGDPTSYNLIADVIDVTSPCGAVRHGAECFNFYFPQELDTSYLVVWDGFEDLPWMTKTEVELRAFLIERVAEGYAFPLNPVWP